MEEAYAFGLANRSISDSSATGVGSHRGAAGGVRLASTRHHSAHRHHGERDSDRHRYHPVPPAPPRACTSNGGATLSEPQASINDLQLLGVRLPDDLPLKPVLDPTAGTQNAVSMNNSVSLNYTFALPPTQQVGYICGVTVQILSFQPFSAPLANVTLPCVDQFYLDPGGWNPSTACPAGTRPAGSAQVVFSESAPGDTTTAAVTNPWVQSMQPGQIPSSAGSNYPAWITVGIQVRAAGTYTFSVNFWQTSAGPSIAAPNVMLAFSLGHYVHEWGGQQCTASTMQTQLPPATNPPSHVICPGPPQSH
jgi:hypothetical protein